MTSSLMYELLTLSGGVIWLIAAMLVAPRRPVTVAAAPASRR